ncbi:NADP-dependent oxidoreductase [Novosphingobium sp. TCA1]|uniref:NADP-dependent oxidoreductase n=1 Tax=Novosphingobium sp. TCA1 TaxID=2682474 RepID=UPI00130C0A41|nr:NADP-dependent oxidoreductase [Novosphingobium sp. TCA1]GFE76100.1 NADP-dependent oxidoreductase [Novosphingobium sp. TCA1]
MTVVARQFHLRARPDGLPTPDNFELVERSLAPPHTGQVLVRNRWLSVDPYMRGRMTGRESYMPPFEIGEPLDGAAIGVVIESEDTGLKPGDVVSHFAGWSDYAVIEATSATKLDPAIPEQAYLGPLGFPGFAAYIGLLRIGKPQSGETVFVSAAAGSVGSLAVQIAKIKGCRVVASAGSEEKLRWLRDEAGVDAAINYKEAGDMSAALDKAAPEGIDVYFDNVGGTHLEAALNAANDFARFALCGMIDQYNSEPSGPRNIYAAIEKSILLQGFITIHNMSVWEDFQRDVARWILDGEVKWQETVLHGLENTPAAFLDLFAGKNSGKMVIDLRGDPQGGS